MQANAKPENHFGHHILPRALREDYRVMSYHFDKYWRVRFVHPCCMCRFLAVMAWLAACKPQLQFWKSCVSQAGNALHVQPEYVPCQLVRPAQQ